MQLRCNYHTSQWAEWHCAHCGKDFCRQCVPGGHDYKLRAGGPKCVLCLKKLEYLGSAVGAPRPSQQFLVNLIFPFQSNALFVYIGLILVTVPFLLLAQTFLISVTILPLLILYTLVLEYAGAILLARSEGKKSPPTWGESFKGMDWLYLVKHVLTVAAGITVTQYAVDIHSFVGFLVGSGCLFIFPASLIILTIDRSISRAINPLLLISMVRSFLKDYIVFYLMALVMATGLWMTFSAIISGGGSLGLSVLWYLILVACVYAGYAMLGYLMFYYQFDLGNSFVVDKGPVLEKPAYEKLRALGDSDVLIAEGRLDDARHVLRATMNSVDRDIEVHDHYHRILLQTDDGEALNNHTNFYLPLLLENDDIKSASKVYRAVKKRLPDFMPTDPSIRIKLADQLRQELDFQEAINCLRSFHEYFPESSLTPEAYLMAAEILHEKLHDSHRAASLLNYVITNFSKSNLSPSVKQYHQRILKHL